MISTAVKAGAGAAFAESCCCSSSSLRTGGSPRRISWLRTPMKEFLGSFWLNPRENQAFAWAWLSRFVLIMGLALLLTYQAFYLIHGLGRLPRPQKSLGKPMVITGSGVSPSPISRTRVWSCLFVPSR